MKRIERLDIYLKSRNINDNMVTNECGLAKGLLYQARKREADISITTCEKILYTYVDLNRKWLITGEGEMLNHPEGGDIVINNVKNNSGNIAGKDFLNNAPQESVEALHKEIQRLSDALDREIEHNAFLKRIIENMMKDSNNN